jgi:hypothetical protein
MPPKKDYSYRSTWKHKFSRARNKAKRGGMTKEEMKKKYGRFPRKKEWGGPDGSEAEWKKRWIAANPKPVPESDLVTSERNVPAPDVSTPKLSDGN